MKLAKSRCKRCRKIFVTTRAEKIYTKHFSVSICPKCWKEFADEYAKRVMEKMFTKKEV